MNSYYFFQNIIHEVEKNEIFSTSNILAFLAILISGLSVLISYRTIFKSKILDLKFHKFENLCLKSLNSILSITDNIFDKNNQDIISLHLQSITNTLTDIQTYLISLRKTTYTDINMDVFIKLIEEFSDKAYNSNSNSKVLDFKSDYLNMKLLIQHELYKYASLVEMRFLFSKYKI